MQSPLQPLPRHSTLWPWRNPWPGPSLQPALVLWCAPSGLFREMESYNRAFPGRERDPRGGRGTGSGPGVPTWTKLILLIAWAGARGPGPGKQLRVPLGSQLPSGWASGVHGPGCRLFLEAAGHAAYGSTCAASDSHWVAAKIAPAVAEPLACLVAGGQACRGLEHGGGSVGADPGARLWRRWCLPPGSTTSVPSRLLSLFLLPKEGWV